MNTGRAGTRGSGTVSEHQETTIAFGPVGLGGLGVLALGLLLRRRRLMLLGLVGVVADVTIRGLGGFRALN